MSWSQVVYKGVLELLTWVFDEFEGGRSAPFTSFKFIKRFKTTATDDAQRKLPTLRTAMIIVIDEISRMSIYLF